MFVCMCVFRVCMCSSVIVRLHVCVCACVRACVTVCVCDGRGSAFGTLHSAKTKSSKATSSVESN